MWGSFGNMAFELFLTPEEVSMKDEERYATVEIYGRKPSVHHVGTQPRRLSLKIKALKSKHIPSVEEYLAQFRDKMQEKSPEILMIGDEVIGNFVIEKMSTVYQRTDHKGTVLQALIDLELLEAE